MDRAPIPFPHGSVETSFNALERDMTEVDAAISLILAGIATSVRLANLSRPHAAAAHAAAVSGELPVRARLEGETIWLTAEPG